jgi:hypothetical protein
MSSKNINNLRRFNKFEKTGPPNQNLTKGLSLKFFSGADMKPGRKA